MKDIVSPYLIVHMHMERKYSRLADMALMKNSLDIPED